MRLRKCKVCGVEFSAAKAQRMCPTCRSQARGATVVLPRTCVQCGAVFPGGPRASYCPSCRDERSKAHKREYQRRKVAGTVRPIGSKDICEVCGKEYIVDGGNQRYCPACAPEAVRAKVLPGKRAWAADRRDDLIDRAAALKADSAVCAYCGKTYTPTSASVTCSEACAMEHARIVQGVADYNRGRRNAPPSHERYSSGLPQSELIGVTYHRHTGKWQVTHRRKYIGLFSTCEEAETKKRELEQTDCS